MPRRVACSGTCGRLLWLGKGSRPQPICRECRADLPTATTRAVVRCAWCDHEVIRRRNPGHATVCSLECRVAWTQYQKGYASSPWFEGIDATWSWKQRRAARIAATSDGQVVRDEVFQRDAWTCHICGMKVKRKASVPDPFAPTIDHVIPLARGGGHTIDNVRTAHYGCNTRKGDLRSGSQLHAVG